jgi:hypothetical protein
MLAQASTGLIATWWAEGRLHEFRASHLAIAVHVGFGERFGRDVDVLGVQVVVQVRYLEER